MKTHRFKTNIECAGCITAVAPKLEAIPGIEKWKVDLESPERTLTVAAREGFSEKEMKSELEKAGYRAEKL